MEYGTKKKLLLNRCEVTANDEVRTSNQALKMIDQNFAQSTCRLLLPEF